MNAISIAALVISPLWGAFVGWSVYRGLLTRLIKHNEIIETSLSLEKRRRAHDSGRTQSVRPGAGPSARVYTALVTRPGALENSRKSQEKG